MEIVKIKMKEVMIKLKVINLIFLMLILWEL